MSINPNEITFVIQGPLGTTIDKKVHLVDGKSTQARVIPEKVIERSITNIRSLYPGAKILLSTWEGQDAATSTTMRCTSRKTRDQTLLDMNGMTNLPTRI